MQPDAIVADLDPDQRAAVTTESSMVAVLAGAGSGKTRVLTRRIAYRIASGSADPQHTLALTFTRESAGELRRRLTRLGMRDRVEAGTFHSVMLAILKQRWADTNRRPLNVVPDRRRILGDSLDPADRRQINGFLAEIDWAAARGIDSKGYSSAARSEQRRPSVGVGRCEAAFAGYEQLKSRRRVIDFDDVLAHVARDMERDSEFADTIRWRFRHILVDEAQDLNPLQHRLVNLLRVGRDDLFLVGDPAQAIYGFNGADPALLLEVETKFPGVEIIRLPLNHRCTPQIVRAGVHVLAATAQPTDIVSSRGDGPLVECLVSSDEEAEARLVAQTIGSIDPNLIRAGEIAILGRTNAQLAEFGSVLKQLGVPVRRSASAAGTPLEATVRQVSALGSAFSLRAWAHDTLDAYDSLQVARAEQTQLQHDASEQQDQRALGRAQRMVEDLEAERRVAAAVLDYLRDQTRGDGAGFRSWVAMSNPFDDRSTNGVVLLTFHASKGREWNTVFVTGVESGLVPHKSATTVATKAEEGRLLYVAATRATDRLFVTRAERRGGYGRTISPFISGLDLSDAPAVPVPHNLRGRRKVGDPLLASLRQWREEVSRHAGMLPRQLCSDRDLVAIAAAQPTTPDELAAATSFGVITATRLAPQILPLVEQANSAAAPHPEKANQ